MPSRSIPNGSFSARSGARQRERIPRRAPLVPSGTGHHPRIPSARTPRPGQRRPGPAASAGRTLPRSWGSSAPGPATRAAGARPGFPDPDMVLRFGRVADVHCAPASRALAIAGRIYGARASPPGRTRPFRRTACRRAAVRVIELRWIPGLAVQRGGRAPHGIDGLVHRFLDQQCRHRRHLRDPTREFIVLVASSSAGNTLLTIPSAWASSAPYAVAGEQFLGLARPELPVSESTRPHAQPGADHIGEHRCPRWRRSVHQASISRRQHGPRAPGRW